MEVSKLSGVGAEITGVDISDLSENEFDGIRAAFADSGLVFFRDQTLSEQDHIAFARRWGEININRFFKANDQFPEIAMVTKEENQEENIGGGWHTDHSYDQEPALGSILVAKELPASGGDTWFSSMYKAYESLSDGLKQTLEGMNAVHSAHHAFGSASEYNRSEGTEGRIGNADVADKLVDPVHPVVIKHPLSGKKALYVNAAFTQHFEGWSKEDSEPLLNYLYSIAINDDFVTKFQWRPGSVAFWDNRATWHFAQNDYHGQRREMHRITVEGCRLTR
jgi:taurine dioxygenase